MKSIALAISILFLVPGLAGAQNQPAPKGYDVEVSFSKALQQRMASINNLEQRLEERFRKNRHYATSPRGAGSQRFAESRTAGTKWAGERLIDEIPDFTLENIVKAMVAYNLNRAAPDFRGRIEIEIDTLKLSNPAIAFLGSIRSYAEGRVKVTSADGRVLFNDQFRANLVIDSTVDTSYDGPALAYGETDPSTRVGPVLAYFVKRALESAWPDRAGDIVGPIIIRVSGPNERVIID